MTQYTATTSINKSFKAILVGSTGCGKSSLLMRYVDNTFVQKYVSTIGLDYRSKKFTKSNQLYNLQLWDTAGQQRYKTLVVNYFKLVKAACIVCDVMDQKSIKECEQWFQQISDKCGQTVKVFVGNKLDLISQEYQGEQLQNYKAKLAQHFKFFQEKYKCKTFLVSAKKGEGVIQVFEYIFDKLYQQHIANSSKLLSNQQSSKLTGVKSLSNLERQKKSPCC